MTWQAGYCDLRGIGGSIAAEEQSGRRYFFARVTFGPIGDNEPWWSRSTETGTLKEAEDWIDEQENEWRDARHAARSASASVVTATAETEKRLQPGTNQSAERNDETPEKKG